MDHKVRSHYPHCLLAYLCCIRLSQQEIVESTNLQAMVGASSDVRVSGYTTKNGGLWKAEVVGSLVRKQEPNTQVKKRKSELHDEYLEGIPSSPRGRRRPAWGMGGREGFYRPVHASSGAHMEPTCVSGGSRMLPWPSTSCWGFRKNIHIEMCQLLRV